MATMTTTQQVEPSSQGNNNDSAETQLKAPKDRECPFCKVSFTSSSLGRHLDLYIRDKNPKPPDGVHDVDYIRKIRRGITRRHARASKGARQARSKSGSSNGGDAEQSSFAEAARQSMSEQANGDAARGQTTSPLSPTTNEPIRDPTNDPIKTYLNKASWQATGVINGLPPYLRDGGVGGAPTPSSTASGAAPQVPPHQQLNFDFITRQKLAEESEARQAAESALREVLEGIQAADARLRKEPLWDFDFFAQNWPGLCLRLLQPNPLIFSGTPKSGAYNRGTWSIGPPKDIPNLWLADIVAKQFRKKGRRLTVYEEDVVSDEPCPPDGKYTPEVNKHTGHIMAREIDWVAMPDERKEEVWRLEILRYCAEQRQKCEEAKNHIEKISAEAARLKWEVEALRSIVGTHRSPGGFDARPYVESKPATTTDVDVIRDLEKSGVNLKEWEFEQLTSKWTQAVRGKKRASAAATNTYNPAATVTISGGGEAMTLGPGSGSSSLQTYAFSDLNRTGRPSQPPNNQQNYQQLTGNTAINGGTSGIQEENEDDINDNDDEDDQGSDVDMADEDDEEEEEDDDDDEPD